LIEILGKNADSEAAIWAKNGNAPLFDMVPMTHLIEVPQSLKIKIRPLSSDSGRSRWLQEWTIDITVNSLPS
jgi:hypothetical protein